MAETGNYTLEYSAARGEVEAVIDQACRELGVERTTAQVEVLPDPAGDPERVQVRVTAVSDAKLQLARQVLEELLEKMRLSASVVARWEPPEEDDSDPVLLLDVQGDDLSLLIGRKGETLAALQYITRLMVAKELSAGLNLVVDVAGHRQRRREQLQRLARRMAEQAVQRGRTLSLEPMPASERRLVHLELRNHPDVRTESVGEGDRRKVTIIPRDR